MNLYQEIAERQRCGEPCVLATIINRRGSTPRKDHAKMLILREGKILGSIGGGCMEAEVWQEAMKAMEDGQSRLLNFDLSAKDAAEGGLVCGGKLDVYLDPILPAPKLIIFGAGHISKVLVQACKILGFQITVADDRESFANQERFPDADQIVVDEFERLCQSIQVDSYTHILIATRGHEFDQMVTEWAVQTPARYIGLLGSKRKVGIIRKHLMKVGIRKEQLSNLFAPIGIDIGSETPEEIAVSVAAELVAVRKNRASPRHDWTK